MSQTTVKVQIQQRYDTAANWTSANPTLLTGEIGWESDTKKYKIGDGSTAWTSLAYPAGAGGYTAGAGVAISGSNVISASAIALSTIQTASSQSAMLSLTTQEGDVVVRSDEKKTYMRNSGSASDMTDFTLLETPLDSVTSVNGNTGAITADQLAAAIESATDSNTFTDADHTKLNGIAASANNYAISADLLDEDNFATNSATKVPSQQSVKAYVDANTANTTYAISCVDGDNTDEEKIRLTAGGSGSGTDDIVLEAGTGLSIARSSDKITFTNTVTNTDTQLTTEEVQDIIGAMVSGNTETNIAVTYDDTNGKLDFVSTDTDTTYSVQDGQLSENNFTDALKNKLDGVATSANNYSHPTTAGNVHIPSGGSAGQFLKYSSSGTAIWSADNDTTYSVGDGGLTQNNFTDTLKTKLDGIATGAEVNVQSDWNSSSGDSQILNKPTIPTNTDTTYSISCVDGDNTDEEKIRLTAGGDGSGTDDIVLEAGTGLTIARSGDKITFTNTVSNTDTQLTEEQVEDYVGGMLTGNTETGITVTYQDSDGTIDFVVDSQTDNNFTTTLKNKLDGIATSANNYSISSDLLDEDDFSTNSDSKVPSQQSTKAYVDTADALQANLSGATFTGAIAGPSASFTDDGSAGPVINISGDDSSIWYGRIGNETYHDNVQTGFKFYVSNGGDATFYHQGNAEYRNWLIGSYDGTTYKTDIYKVASSGNLALYQNGNIRLTTTSAGITVTGSVTDTKGDVRSIPLNSKSSSYTLVAADAGKAIVITSGGVTVPDDVFSAAGGDAVTIINNSGSNQTITQGSGVTMYNTADGSTGNRTLAGRGMATLLFTAVDNAYISGAGLS